MSKQQIVKPNFLIVGSQKSGTTSLHYYLSQHHEIFCSVDKELHYFDNCYKTKSFTQYLKNFQPAVGKKLIGESTPIYMFYPDCARKIREALGVIKIVILLREPVLRAYSHYWHEVKLGWECLSFEDAVRNENTRIANNDLCFRHYSYAARSLYSRQIRAFVNEFGSENVGVFKFEDLISQPLLVTNQVIAFLSQDLAAMTNLASESKNESKLPLFPRLNRLAGKIEEIAGENLLSKLIITSNNRKMSYPKLSTTIADCVRAKMYESDPNLTEYYSWCAQNQNVTLPIETGSDAG